jgi:hypothetical protein
MDKVRPLTPDKKINFYVIWSADIMLLSLTVISTSCFIVPPLCGTRNMTSVATVLIYSLHLYHQEQQRHVATGVTLQEKKKKINVRTQIRKRYGRSQERSVPKDQCLYYTCSSSWTESNVDLYRLPWPGLDVQLLNLIIYLALFMFCSTTDFIIRFTLQLSKHFDLL